MIEQATLKKLPRDEKGNYAREFVANGTTYIIRTQEEGIGINRYCRLLNMSSVWGLQADFGSQVNAWRKATKALDNALNGKGSFGEFYGIAQSAVDGINRAGQTNYTFAFWVACLFIVKKDENMLEFVEADQQKKIEDWATEGIHEYEFEEIVKKKLQEFSQKLQKSSKELSQTETSSDDTESTETK